MNVIIVHSPGATIFGVYHDDERGKQLAERVFAHERESARTVIAVEDGRTLTREERIVMLAIYHATTPTADEMTALPALIASGHVAIEPLPRGVGFVVTPRGQALLDDGITP